jgi:uncharacterized low-complexity protein
MNRLKFTTCVVTAAMLFVLPASASAKSPPKGKYECVISGSYFGEVVIKSSSKYRRNGKTGSYKAGANKIKFKEGFSGYRLTFKTGGFKGFKGRWHKTTDGKYEIALKNPINNFESIYCDK